MPSEHVVSALRDFNWNDYVLFAVASLFAVGVFIAIALGNYDSSLQNRSILARGNKFLRILFGTLLVIWVLVVACTGIALGLAVYARFSADAVLAALTGAAFGALTARFVWTLFGPNFVIMEAVFGAGVFVLLSIAYSLPVYKQPILALFERIGITSVKTPVAEFTFAERSTRRPVQNTGSQAGTPIISGIPRPSDPTPGLGFLAQVVSKSTGDGKAPIACQSSNAGKINQNKPIDQDAGFAEKDRFYTIFFGEEEKQCHAFEIIDDIETLLQPMHKLAGCLQDYAVVVKDAQLLAIDLKPLLTELFRVQTIMLSEVSNLGKSRASWDDWNPVNAAIVSLMREIRNRFEFDPDVSGHCDPEQVTHRHDEKDKKIIERLSPWQPYLVIALSSLLMAHGSTDEGIDVLAKWLETWKCAREGGTGCNISMHEQDEAKKLPEWFGFRAEFQMNILLNQWAGNNNVIYRDFLKDHAGRFERFAKTNGRVRLDDAFETCENKTKRVTPREQTETGWRTQILNLLSAFGENYDEWRIRVIQLLLDEENDTLIAERNFLFEAGMPDLENLYERAKRLARFSPECIEPRDEKIKERGRWEPVSASYRVTAGLLGIAVAERMNRIADSAYDRNSAVEIRKESTVNVREGYRTLKKLRDEFRKLHSTDPLSKRVFVTFAQEEAYSAAGQAIERLSAAEP
jgi:hypothetical protein